MTTSPGRACSVAVHFAVDICDRVLQLGSARQAYVMRLSGVV